MKHIFATPRKMPKKHIHAGWFGLGESLLSRVVGKYPGGTMLSNENTIFYQRRNEVKLSKNLEKLLSKKSFELTFTSFLLSLASFLIKSFQAPKVG